MANNGYIKNTDSSGLLMPLPFGATLGRVAGHSRVAIYGHTPTPTANTDVLGGSIALPIPDGGQRFGNSFGFRTDTAAGTGARTMMVVGLDTNFNPISEIITMNGVTPVQTVNSYLRVNGLNLATAVAVTYNAGDITLRLTGAGATQAIARAGYGFAKQCVYTVPAGFTLLSTDVLPECGGTSAAPGTS